MDYELRSRTCPQGVTQQVDKVLSTCPFTKSGLGQLLTFKLGSHAIGSSHNVILGCNKTTNS